MGKGKKMARRRDTIRAGDQSDQETDCGTAAEIAG
jgi:hypothetical protein